MVISFVAILVFSLLLLRYHNRNLPPSGLPEHPLIVEIAGEVRNPGVYVLEGPALTVEEAIGYAGGLKDGMLFSRSDSAPHKTLTHMKRLVIEMAGEGRVMVKTEAMSAKNRLALGGKLDINKASEEELLLVPRMQPSFATAIVERRKTQPWTNLADLTEIPGIGLKTVEKWRQYLDVGP